MDFEDFAKKYRQLGVNINQLSPVLYEILIDWEVDTYWDEDEAAKREYDNDWLVDVIDKMKQELEEECFKYFKLTDRITIYTFFEYTVLLDENY